MVLRQAGGIYAGCGTSGGAVQRASLRRLAARKIQLLECHWIHTVSL
jgi:hypothetical protein